MGSVVTLICSGPTSRGDWPTVDSHKVPGLPAGFFDAEFVMGEKDTDVEALYGRWVHSNEEDTPEELVFRPPGYKFPPSRGRTAFELGPNHTYTGAGIGRNDVSAVSHGRWTLERDDDLKIRVEHDGGQEVLDITSVQDGRLTIRKKDLP
jgi:hypothetical protein